MDNKIRKKLEMSPLTSQAQSISNEKGDVFSDKFNSDELTEKTAERIIFVLTGRIRPVDEFGNFAKDQTFQKVKEEYDELFSSTKELFSDLGEISEDGLQREAERIVFALTGRKRPVDKSDNVAKDQTFQERREQYEELVNLAIIILRDFNRTRK